VAQVEASARDSSGSSSAAIGFNVQGRTGTSGRIFPDARPDPAFDFRRCTMSAIATIPTLDRWVMIGLAACRLAVSIRMFRPWWSAVYLRSVKCL
jgi:hypothetical protein